MKRLLASALLLYVSLLPLGAQSTAVSQVSGVVQDASGAAIPAAQVTITNVDTSASRTVETGAEGAYTFTNLVVGPYKLQVTKDGFATYNQTGIVLQVNSNPQVNVTLKVGAVSEQIEVQANAAMVEAHSNGVGQVIDLQRVLDLPLNGRDVTQLIAISGAAVSAVQPNSAGTATGTGGIVNNLNYPTVAAFSVAGGQGNATNYFLDGGTHLDPRTNVGLPLPFPDALQEFKVETSTLPANYGSHPGGAVNVVTKAGTNAFHGDAFWFVRNYVFNARNFFAASRDSLKRNQFGGVVGGPIVKNKVFFFAGYQGTTLRTAPATVQAFVPTADVLQGNFTTILSPPCQGTRVNLSSTVASNNILLPGKINPVAQKFLALLPVSSDPCGKVLYGVPTLANEYQGVTRVDWQRTQSDLIFARYFVTDYYLTPFYDKTNLLTAGTAGLLDRVQSLILGDTYLINARTISSFRASFARSAVQRVGADGIPNMAQLGSNVASPIQNYTGQIQVSNYFSTGAIPGWVYTNVYTLAEDVAMSLGAHQIAIGASWVHTQMNGNGPFQMNPRMTFNGQLTGNALADFLTGSLDTMLQGGGQVSRDGDNMPSLYVQDNWKITRRFQVNAGIRWDPFIPQHTKYNYASQFDPAKFYSGQVSKVFVNAPPGLTFPGDAGYPGQSDTFARYSEFAPRLGVIFDPRGKGLETIRAGYGIFYDSTYLWNTLHVPLNPPWGYTLTLNAPVGGLSNPWLNFPGGNPFPAPTTFPANFQFPNAGTYVFEPLHANPTYLQQWNVSFQKQLSADWLVSATYLGNKTTHQWLSTQLNPAVFGPGATIANTDARRVYNLANPATGKFYGRVDEIDDGGNASYNGLLLVLQHRFSHNFSALANYTWSHCMDQGEANQDILNQYQDPANRRAEWGNCAADRRNLVNLSLVGHAPKFSSKLVQALAGNWQASAIYSFSSGPWLTVTDGTDISLTGNNNDRPNVAGDSNVANPTIRQWFNTAAFVKQTAGTYGNAGRGIILGPSSWNIDAALWRTFPIRESLRLDVRWEAFNILNHARFNVPVVALNAGNFGQITSARDPRIMQLAMKVTF